MAAVCLTLSAGLHAISAVVLGVFPFGADPVTPPITSVDPGAHSISVMIIPSAPEPEPPPPAHDPVEPTPTPTPTQTPAQTPTQTSAPAPTMPTPAHALRQTLNEILLVFTAPPEQRDRRESIARSPVIPPPDAPAPQDAHSPPERINPRPAVEEVEIAASDADDAGATTGVEIIGQLAPEYPSRSRRLGEQGLVVLDVHILPTGETGDIRVLRNPGHRRLVAAAIDAVSAAKFRPATREGQPVAAWLTVPVRFVIE